MAFPRTLECRVRLDVLVICPSEENWVTTPFALAILFRVTISAFGVRTKVGGYYWISMSSKFRTLITQSFYQTFISYVLARPQISGQTTNYVQSLLRLRSHAPASFGHDWHT
jgi:hypothetical protein